MISRSTDSRKLDEQGALSELAHPWWPRSIGWPKPKVSTGGIVRVAFEVPPVLLGIGKARSRLKQKHVQPATCELLRDDCSTSSSSNNDDITHSVSPSPHLAAVLEIPQELIPAVCYTLVIRQVPCNRIAC